MLKVDSIEKGIVLDHIKAGKAMQIYKHLNLDNLDCSVAIIKNAKSSKMGKKDIIKIEQHIDIDFDMLAVLEPHMTINYIKDGVRVEKRQLNLPEKIYGIIKCKNPRCITSIEQELPHRFKLTNREKGIYRCEYCEQSFKQSNKKKK